MISKNSWTPSEPLKLSIARKHPGVPVPIEKTVRYIRHREWDHLTLHKKRNPQNASIGLNRPLEAFFISGLVIVIC
jgi:hypothetical protein